MYICVCNAITDKQVEEASKSCANYGEVFKRLGVGSDCGMCLHDAISKHNPEIQKKDTNKQGYDRPNRLDATRRLLLSVYLSKGSVHPYPSSRATPKSPSNGSFRIRLHSSLGF